MTKGTENCLGLPRQAQQHHELTSSASPQIVCVGAHMPQAAAVLRRPHQAPRITGSAEPVAADEPGEHLALVSSPVRGALREAAMVGEGKENLMPSPPVRSAKARTAMDPSDCKCGAHNETCMRGHHVDAECLRVVTA